MPDREAIERGFDFEDRISHILSMRKQPGSGNKFFAQGDCEGNGLLISAKSEKDFTWSKIINYLSEALDMASGTGNIPVLALQDVKNQDEYIVLRLHDFGKSLREVKIPESYISKGIEKRTTAEIPLMLRS